ncbi:MAG: hypothetical protein WCU88_08510 [Elusimicrobiota bacterium]|jgi:hypothetical protein
MKSLVCSVVALLLGVGNVFAAASSGFPDADQGLQVADFTRYDGREYKASAAGPKDEVGVKTPAADENMNTSIQSRKRAIGEKNLVAVGECYHSISGNFLDKYAFELTYEQQMESYLVEVKDGRGMFNTAHSESLIPGSQKETVEKVTEVKETANLSGERDNGEGACKQMRAVYVQQLKTATQ